MLPIIIIQKNIAGSRSALKFALDKKEKNENKYSYKFWNPKY